MGAAIVTAATNENKKDKKKGKKGGGKNEEEEKEQKKKKDIIVEDLRENHTFNRVCFEVKLLPGIASKLNKDDDLVVKTFNLQSSLTINNMVLFSPEGKIKKYSTIEERLQTFYDLRRQYYQIRKDYMISVLKKEVATLSNKARFIKMVVEDELIIKKKKRAVLVNEL